MNLFRYNPDLILGDLPLPEGFSAVAPVTTEKYPLGAVLLQNAAGIYWIWSGGALSGCDQREAARFVREQQKPALVPIAEYAKAHGLDPATVRQKALRGGWKTAVKLGRNWFIDPDEPHTDRRRAENEDSPA